MGIIRLGLSLTLYKAATLHRPLQFFSSSVPSSPLIPVCLFVCLQLLAPGVPGNLFPNQIKAVLQITHTHSSHSQKALAPSAPHYSSASLLPPQAWPRGFEWALGSGDCRLQGWAEAQPCLILQELLLEPRLLLQSHIWEEPNMLVLSIKNSFFQKCPQLDPRHSALCDSHHP